jgi:hypothetical protein
LSREGSKLSRSSDDDSKRGKTLYFFHLSLYKLLHVYTLFIIMTETEMIIILYSVIHSFIRSFHHSFIRSFICLFSYLSIQLFVYYSNIITFIIIETAVRPPTAKGRINFVAAKQKQISEKVASRTRKRGQVRDTTSF